MDTGSSLPRTLGEDTVLTLSFEVRKISIDTEVSEDTCRFYIELYIGDTNPLPATQDQIANTSAYNTSFSFERGDVTCVLSEEVDGNITYQTLAYTVQVYQENGTFSGSLSNGVLEVIIDYGLRNAEGQFPAGKTLNDQEITVEQANSLVSDAPSSFTVESTHRSLIAKWAVPEFVTYTKIDDTAVTTEQGKPVNVEVFVIEYDPNLTGQVLLPGAGSFFALDTALDGQEATCAYDPIAAVAGGECIVCNAQADASVYLNFSTLRSLDIVSNSANVATTSSQIKFSNLDPEKQYVLFSTYAQGLSRSNCELASPGENLSLTEWNGEDEATLSKAPCFIATVAYGSVLNGLLEDFRWYRSILLSSWAGRHVVAFYYHFGRYAADYISESPFLKWGARVALLPLALVFFLGHLIADKPILWGLLLSTLALVAIFRFRPLRL